MIPIYDDSTYRTKRTTNHFSKPIQLKEIRIIMNTIIYVRTTYLLKHRLHVSTLGHPQACGRQVIGAVCILGSQYTHNTYDLSAAGLRMT